MDEEEELFEMIDKSTMSEDSSTDSSSGSTVCVTNKFTDLLKKKEKIGSGGFGSVFRCLHILEEKDYAVKRIGLKNNTKKLDWYLGEVRAISSMEHKNVVRYHQSWTDLSCDGFSSDESDHSDSSDESEGSDLYLFIQMEFCPRTLKSRLKTNPTNSQQALLYLHDLLEGLAYIHKSGYLHRDLAKKNIFFGKDKNIKIGDFGLAKKMDDNMSCSHSPHSTTYGKGLHRAPELLENQPFSRKSDLYALGIVFLEMLLSPMKYDDHDTIRNILKIKEGKFPHWLENKFETAILKSLLAKSPNDRPTADELIHLISSKLCKLKEGNENANG
ncbi:hypothetical protein POM88_014943 [Heracleum sosnowskyi]|uniref:Protein kinase domain-containing protein n=1 Tax=Heracleum sosnowskyi TaxID=360622 RepID=A0AAD8IJA1_9APIA|nr:hypothetical protein POM88_014943 [Heracleum sosnowskyi]